MATLQKIRSKGLLLTAIIGLALFAFIAGDAWQVLQSHQMRDAGEIDGEAISAQDFQKMVEEYTEVVKLSRGLPSLTDEQANMVNDEVWNAYVNNKLIEKEAKKLGLTVSAAEIQDILTAGVHPLLQQLPFRNPQTGRFDRDMLNQFLVEYAKIDRTQLPAQYVEDYDNMYKYWSFVEKTLYQTRLAQKYQMLVSKSLLSNPIEAQNAFDANANQYDLLLAAIPYSTVADSTLTVSESELRDLYNKKKEQFKQYQESRDIKYIDIQVTASADDRKAIQAEVDEATEQLAAATDNYTSLIRSVGSDVPYVDLYYNRTAYPSDVEARLDSASVGSIYGPYYNGADNTLNSFKIVAKTTIPDSIQFRQIRVIAETPDKTKTLTDSIYNALKNGADFAELAKKYGQTGDNLWLTGAQYENAQVEGDDLKFINAINNAEPNKLMSMSVGQANLIYQITERKAVKEKYKVAVVKRKVEFSKETYNRAYNDFSQFIAANPTVEQMVQHAEEAGYTVLDRRDLYSSEHVIGGVRGTKEALRWVFETAKPGEVSGLYECGENDHMLVVGLVGVNPQGYRSIEQVKEQLRAELIKDKKAEKIIADMKAANATSLDQYKAMSGAVSDSLKLVTFGASAYVPSLHGSEPLISAYASVAEENQLSAPIEGTFGVYALQLYAKNKTDETFDVKEEEQNMINMHVRFANRLMNDLYLKANVKDTRYLFF